MALLRDAPDGLRLAALAKLIGISPPTASDMVGALVAKGLVSKLPGPDRRSINLILTPEGDAAAERTRDWPDFLADAVDTLPAGEQAGLLRGLVRVVRALQVNGDIPPQRMCVSCRFFRPYAHDDDLNPHHCAYVDAAFGDRHLRLNCGEHQSAEPDEQETLWQLFTPPTGVGTGVAH